MTGNRKLIAYSITIATVALLNATGTLDSASTATVLSASIWAFVGGNIGEHFAKRNTNATP